jgi:hypothetical protein
VDEENASAFFDIRPVIVIETEKASMQSDLGLWLKKFGEMNGAAKGNDISND